VLDDWRSAPIDEKFRTTLGFLEKLTLTPGDIGQDDITLMREAGVSDQAIEDAIYVCVYFNIIDRIADSLDFEVLTAEAFVQRAGNFLREGYLKSFGPIN
jgi:alkylhydroperoxidase family enzyme